MILYVEVLVALSAVGYASTLWLVPTFREQFLRAKISGTDMNKIDKREIPEATGAIAGCVYLMITFVMLPISFSDFVRGHQDVFDFPHVDLVLMLAALLSIACMLLLGFADDVLDLRWRHKLILPTLSCLPVLLVYFVTTNHTGILLPFFLRPAMLAPYGGVIHLGIFYYIYMGMLAVFCTNAINIFSGINGLEVGQSVLIGCAVAAFNMIELNSAIDESVANFHRLSLYFILPYIGTSLALLKLNSYPASVFVGDTFCYFSGMTFAVVAILGHFSKTLLLFFLPQIFNFLYSLPQLFRILPCPRHRLPTLNTDTGMLVCSTFDVTCSKLSGVARLLIQLFDKLNLASVRPVEGDKIQVNNLTVINLYIHWFGPHHESVLMHRLMILQSVSLAAAFVIRYPLAHFIYSYDL